MQTNIIRELIKTQQDGKKKNKNIRTADKAINKYKKNILT